MEFSNANTQAMSSKHKQFKAVESAMVRLDELLSQNNGSSNELKQLKVEHSTLEDLTVDLLNDFYRMVKNKHHNLTVVAHPQQSAVKVHSFNSKNIESPLVLNFDPNGNVSLESFGDHSKVDLYITKQALSF